VNSRKGQEASVVHAYRLSKMMQLEFIGKGGYHGKKKRLPRGEEGGSKMGNCLSGEWAAYIWSNISSLTAEHLEKVVLRAGPQDKVGGEVQSLKRRYGTVDDALSGKETELGKGGERPRLQELRWQMFTQSAILPAAKKVLGKKGKCLRN